MTMRPVRGWEPWRRGRFRRRMRAFRGWLFRRDCAHGHQERRAHIREHGSQFYIALTVCARCGALLEAEGRRRHNSK